MFDQITWNLSGAEIEAESFRRIDAEASPALKKRFTPAEWHIVRRLIHTTADFSIAENLEFHGNPVAATRNALSRGAVIYCDSNMIKAGLSIPKLRKYHSIYSRESIVCPVADHETAELAAREHITRALAAVRLHQKQIDGGIFLCGNAPLALAETVRLTSEGIIRPAFLVGMPVGFVNVVESKKLMDQIDIPWIRLNGRRGGSPLAVAALHAVMEDFAL